MIKTFCLIVVFISLFAIFSSNLFVNKGSSQGLGNFLDKLFDGHDNGKNMKKKIEKELKDNEDDKDNKQNSETESFATEDYNFADEGDMKRKDFNFAVAGDFGCSKNAENTVSNMEGKKPELVIPLGDLSYSKSANCWLDLISPFSDKLKVTLGYHDVNDGASKLNQYEHSFGLKNIMILLITDTSIL